MITEKDKDSRIAELARRHPEYRADAYRFVLKSLNVAIGRRPEHGHVSAAELLAGLRDCAAGEFGPLAGAVLSDWGLAAASDVGVVVYRLIGARLLAMNPDDRPEDFNCDFELAAPVSARPRRKLPAVPVIA